MSEKGGVLPGRGSAPWIGAVAQRRELTAAGHSNSTSAVTATAATLRIGILNTWSELTPCNGHLRELAEKVKAGVWEAGASATVGCRMLRIPPEQLCGDIAMLRICR